MKQGQFVIPEWLDKETWAEFEEMRKKYRKPLTDGARRLAVKKLLMLYEQGHDPHEVLEQSILNGWQGLWPIVKSKGERADDELRRMVNVGRGPEVRH